MFQSSKMVKGSIPPGGLIPAENHLLLDIARGPRARFSGEIKRETLRRQDTEIDKWHCAFYISAWENGRRVTQLEGRWMSGWVVSVPGPVTFTRQLLLCVAEGNATGNVLKLLSWLKRIYPLDGRGNGVGTGWNRRWRKSPERLLSR